jgi:hypothetical protein
MIHILVAMSFCPTEIVALLSEDVIEMAAGRTSWSNQESKLLLVTASTSRLDNEIREASGAQS